MKTVAHSPKKKIFNIQKGIQMQILRKYRNRNRAQNLNSSKDLRQKRKD